MDSRLTTIELNELILSNESKPFKMPDPNTYLNGDLHLAIMEKRMDLKMLRCIVWSRNPDIEATAEQLYSISPDYFGDKKVCYGMGQNEVTSNLLHIPSPDHKIPISRGGSKTIENIVIVPRIYNIWKRDMLKEDWIKFRDWMDQHIG